MNLSGKTVFITGATDGLGKAVAHKAAQAGATLLIHGRNPTKGEQIVQALKTQTGNHNIFYYNADFASLQAVKELSEAILSRHEHVHVLINNAAIGGGPKGSKQRERSKDGYELRFAVNYLSHYLLTQNLLPLIVLSAPARIVHVSSIGQAPINFTDLMLEKQYDSFEAYCRSKLAQIMYGFDGAEHLKKKGVTVNSLHPATLMDTNMVHDFFGRVSSSVQEGVEVVEHVGFSPETAGITGAYFNQKKQARAHSQAYDSTARKELRQISEELTNPYHIQS